MKQNICSLLAAIKADISENIKAFITPRFL